MAYCPQCMTEYMEGSPECIDCHVALQPGPPPSKPPAPELLREAKLVRVHVFSGGTAVMQAELARSWLESEGIPCVVSGESSVAMLPVLDVPLFVSREDEEKARRILREYLESEPPEAEG
jgi:Putative prokaryotic signal transducing protein